MKNESLIVKFFENTLSPEELDEFNELMTNDSEFRIDVEFRKELQEVITLNDRETIKQELKGLENEKPKKKMRIWPIAASIVVLLGVSSFWIFSNSDVSAEELFNSNFEPYRNIVEPIVRGETNGSIRTKAFSAYEQKDYQTALKHINVLLKEDPSSTLRFYKANVLLQLDKEEEAADIFKDNLKKSDSLIEKNQWYLALTYVKLNQYDLAKAQLDALINNSKSEYKKKEAKHLLKKLK